jgi:hypothetical protein
MKNDQEKMFLLWKLKKYSDIIEEEDEKPY